MFNFVSSNTMITKLLISQQLRYLFGYPILVLLILDYKMFQSSISLVILHYIAIWLLNISSLRNTMLWKHFLGWFVTVSLLIFIYLFLNSFIFISSFMLFWDVLTMVAYGTTMAVIAAVEPAHCLLDLALCLVVNLVLRFAGECCYAQIMHSLWNFMLKDWDIKIKCGYFSSSLFLALIFLVGVVLNEWVDLANG